ncbi:DUF1015 domain-containing protein [Zunongwangia sp. HGR-M22]|uniref:DUF1015 domain-containing protein n=1 Tax=Zunongwangia sp. HGR-M22 TaxID=3015168 RepID=UPI0022DDFA79|nr:DUF1015 domain-containing protein [Zunongwangia sp. HGR-M22]WBL24946.1 DUF1015 domain-containing protein [Zunongwangia sp. HGR-M22]
MVKITPFKAVRPQRAKAGLVASRPYGEYNEAEMRARLDYNPYSFLHILNPGYKFQHTISGTQKFQLIKNRYMEFKEEDTFIQDENPCFYVYKMESRDLSCCGIIAAASAEDYKNGIIKKHEDTIASREILFKDYVKTVGFNTEPVLLTYENRPEIQAFLAKIMQQNPEYEFATRQREMHYLWKIDNKAEIEQIQQFFSNMDSIYIADGHHRCASSFLLSQESAKNNENHTGKESYNHFLSYFIPENDLKIYQFRRLITDLNGYSKEDFLIKLDEHFRIENRKLDAYQPEKKHHFKMYLDGEFYSLYLRKTSMNFTDTLSQLDSQILYDLVLKPILGINDLRKDKRINYIPGKRDILEMKKLIDSGEFSVGFGMLPVSISEIKKIADEGLTMPPKSTYIEPKLRSGLTIYEF